MGIRSIRVSLFYSYFTSIPQRGLPFVRNFKYRSIREDFTGSSPPTTLPVPTVGTLRGKHSLKPHDEAQSTQQLRGRDKSSPSPGRSYFGATRCILIRATAPLAARFITRPESRLLSRNLHPQKFIIHRRMGNKLLWGLFVISGPGTAVLAAAAMNVPNLRSSPSARCVRVRAHGDTFTCRDLLRN